MPSPKDAKNERTPLHSHGRDDDVPTGTGTVGDGTSNSSALLPIPDGIGKSRIAVATDAARTMCLVAFGAIGGLLFLTAFLVLTLTGIGPLIELYLSRRDEKALDRRIVLRDHPEMFLLDIPPDVNGASLGRPYKIMVRLTQPPSPPAGPTPLPPVIFPGGLASNLMTMSKAQDELTARHGFTVVNFDRLGVGFSDPYPDLSEGNAGGAEGAASQRRLHPPSAADVAREMKYVMDHCGAARTTDERWIQVGGSMGTNVATAFAALFPGRLCGFLNLDGLPHAFLQIQCKKFLKDGNALMTMMRRLRWTGLPRLGFFAALRPMLPVMGDAFCPRQILGVMCRDQFFTTTGLEYTTLMSCCDLEVAAWGPQATTEYDAETMRLMASLAPDESVIIDELAGIERTVTDERAKSELGRKYVSRDDPAFAEFEAHFRTFALQSPDDIDRAKTHCNWPDPNPRHPVGDLVGGVDRDTAIHPLARVFEKMCVRVMCARNYKGLERDYTQEARNHAAARSALHSLMSGNGKVYYYPRLTHLNLWQQSSEIVNITWEIAQESKKCRSGSVHQQ